MRLVRLISLALLALVAVAARAQTVHWEASDAGVPNAAVLIFENCEPDGQPELPAIPGVTFTFLGRSESTQSSFGNGGFVTTRTVALSYMVRARQNSPVQIPAFTVKTSKGPQRVAAYNAAAPAPPLQSVASAKLVPERTSVWAGEVFGLTYELSAARHTNPQISPTFDWNATPLVAEDWSKPEVSEAIVQNERRVNVLFRTRVAAKAPGTVKLDAATHLLSIQTGTIGFGIISQPRMEQVSVTSDQPSVEVRPLPPAPTGFTGAVGQFKLNSKVVPEKAAVGEPVTWTLELSGTGNWPDLAGLPSREVSNDFQVVQPKAKRTPAEGKLFDVTLAEDVVLVPSKAGTYTLGPVNVIYFDPKSGTYKTVTAPRTTVTIAAPASAPFSVNLQPASISEPPPPPVKKSTPPPAAPSAPAGIPRDPLPGSDEVSAPLARTTLEANLAAPFAVLLAVWLWLATKRARQTDPVRPRREARDRLARTLAHLSSAAPAERPALLLSWQRDTAVLWQINAAAPRASALPDATWAALWTDAERSLYRANTPLPADWIARAQEALAALRVPGFKPLRLFLPQNLMPFAASLTVLLVVGAAWLHAAEADALSAYRKGDFAGAEKSWRTAAAQHPTDWIVRHNLALALAQQERAPEAAAQATAAFVQQPADASVRWHFALAAEKAGAAPSALAQFLAPGPRQTIGRLASPAVWQRILILAAWLVAAAAARWLFNAYGRRARAPRWFALAGGILGLGLASSAVAGISSYGIAADPDAVIVARPGILRSIPTEADSTQKTTALAGGSMARIQTVFQLGWVQLAFANGQTGWVRKEDVVPLWKTL